MKIIYKCCREKERVLEECSFSPRPVQPYISLDDDIANVTVEVESDDDMWTHLKRFQTFTD